MSPSELMIRLFDADVFVKVNGGNVLETHAAVKELKRYVPADNGVSDPKPTEKDKFIVDGTLFGSLES